MKDFLKFSMQMCKWYFSNYDVDAPIGSGPWTVLEHFIQDRSGTLQYTIGGNVVSSSLRLLPWFESGTHSQLCWLVSDIQWRYISLCHYVIWTADFRSESRVLQPLSHPDIEENNAAIRVRIHNCEEKRWNAINTCLVRLEQHDTFVLWVA